jgi:hypothetical protein
MAENVEPVKQLFDDLFTLLEALETQSLAVMELLQDEGIGTEEKLKPYLERAGNASSVKWRAARVRMEYLLTPTKKEERKEEGNNEKKGAEAFWKNKPEEGKKDGEPKDDNKKGDGQSVAGKQATEKGGADAKGSEKQGADKPVPGKADGGADAKAKSAGADGGKERKK